MDAKSFFMKVSEMREAQIYFQHNRTSTALGRCIELENEVDAEITRVQTIMNNKK